jgi:hypothetical protein
MHTNTHITQNNTIENKQTKKKISSKATQRVKYILQQMNNSTEEENI